MTRRWNTLPPPTPADIDRILANLPHGPAPGAPRMSTSTRCDTCDKVLDNRTHLHVETQMAPITYQPVDRIDADFCDWKCLGYAADRRNDPT